MVTGRCPDFPCLMELLLVVMVRTFSNYRKSEGQMGRIQDFQNSIYSRKSVNRVYMLTSYSCSWCTNTISSDSWKIMLYTFASRPTSRQSWRPTLSSRADTRGLKTERERVRECWQSLCPYISSMANSNWTLFNVSLPLSYEFDVKLQISCSYLPIHAREVSPKIARSVCRTDFHGVNENGVTLEKRWLKKQIN